MSTPILALDEGADGQTDLYALYNAMGRGIEAAALDYLQVDLSGGDATLSAANFRGYYLFECISHTSPVALTVTNIDTSVSPNTAIRRPFAVYNNGAGVLIVTIGTSSILVEVGQTRVLYTDGTANDLMAIDAWQVSVVEDHTLTQPPSTSPLNAVGTVYIVNSGSPSGAWAGFTAGNFAIHIGAGSYVELAARDGQIVRTKDLSASPHVPRLIYWDADAAAWSNV